MIFWNKTKIWKIVLKQSHKIWICSFFQFRMSSTNGAPRGAQRGSGSSGNKKKAPVTSNSDRRPFFLRVQVRCCLIFWEVLLVNVMDSECASASRILRKEESNVNISQNACYMRDSELWRKGPFWNWGSWSWIQECCNVEDILGINSYSELLGGWWAIGHRTSWS